MGAGAASSAFEAPSLCARTAEIVSVDWRIAICESSTTVTVSERTDHSCSHRRTGATMRGSGVFAGLVFITLELDVASVSSARWAYVSLNAKTRIAVMPARMITRRREKPAAARKSRRYARFERDLRVISCTTLYSSCADRMPSRSLSSDLRRLYTSSSNFETRPSPSRSGLSTFRSIVPARFSPPLGAAAFLPAAVSAGFELSGGVAGGVSAAASSAAASISRWRNACCAATASGCDMVAECLYDGLRARGEHGEAGS